MKRERLTLLDRVSGVFLAGQMSALVRAILPDDPCNRDQLCTACLGLCPQTKSIWLWRHRACMLGLMRAKGETVLAPAGRLLIDLLLTPHPWVPFDRG